MNRSQAGKLGNIASQSTQQALKQKRIALYEESPSLCKQCDTAQPYIKRKNKFCDSSCAASYNNSKRIRKTFNCAHCNTQNNHSHSSTNTYCNLKCQHDFQYKQRIDNWLNEGISWKMQIPKWAKRYLLELRGDKCEICDTTEWMGQHVPLECDHVDGIHTNNDPSNLRMICPNCHAQTPTYKNKNKGNGRTIRRKS